MTTPDPYGRIAAGYRIVGRLRRGPDATVYHAIREAGDSAVALKVLRTDAHIDVELSQVRRLPRHPNIVPVLDHGRTLDGRPYLAMPYYPDGSYADLLSNTGPVDVDEAVRVGIAIAGALQATHDVDLVHRDVTPANILRGSDGPALTDFGIAAMPAELAGTVALDRLTPPHASPEALLRQPQDARSDVYGLGSTLWTILTGHPPFSEPTDVSPDPFEYRERALHEPVPPVPGAEVPDWLQGALTRAMAKDPEDRYPSAGAFADALRERTEPWHAPLRSTPMPPAPALAPIPTPVTPVPVPRPAPVPIPRPVPALASTHVPMPVPLPVPLPVTVPVPVPAAASAHVPAPIPLPDLPAYKAPDASAHPGPGPGWWAPEDVVPMTPTEQHFGDVERHRDAPRRRLLASSVALAVVAVVGLAAFLLTPVVRNSFRADAPATPVPTVTATPTTVPGIAPAEVRLADERIAVTLTWRDPTGGEAVFYVVGTPAGGTSSTVANASRGKTSVRVNGLNPTVNYCFVLVAALSVDEVANSDEVCTNRFATPSSAAPSSPAPSPST